MLRAVTEAPLVVAAALQIWVMTWPLANVQFTAQPVIADVPAVTFTSAWNPPGHWLVMVYVAPQVRPVGGGVLVEGGVVGGGVEAGGVVGGGVVTGGVVGGVDVGGVVWPL